jgi:hypothetical protein
MPAVLATPTPAQPPISTPFCPEGSKGFFVLYYGTAVNEFRLIRELHPDFVIGDVAAGDIAQGNLASFYNQMHDLSSGLPSVRSILYKSTKENDKPSSANPAEVDAYVKKALSIGYEGIFFDDIDASRHEYNYARAKVVKDFDRSRIVIMNPGVVVTDKRIFDYADIVSVENKWFEVLPLWNDIKPYRWLAVQGDPGNETGSNYIPPSTLNEAMRRLIEFRSGKHNNIQGGKGFWYYTSGDRLWKLPSFGPGNFKNSIANLNGADNICP